MECPNCHFHNMPGNTRCLKCRAPLDVAAQAISVEPPRASARSKRLRKWLPRGAGHLFPIWLRDRVQAAAGRLNPARAPAGALVRMVIPGWGQWYLGNAARARNYFVPWLLLMLILLPNWYSVRGSAVLYAAICVHAISIIDLLSRSARRAK